MAAILPLLFTAADPSAFLPSGPTATLRFVSTVHP